MASIKPGPQRRLHPRQCVHVEVRWHHRGAEGARAELRDISVGGAYLVPNNPPPGAVAKDSVVWIVIDDPKGEIVLTGAVRWFGYSQVHEVVGYGIEFDGSCHETAQKVLFTLRPPA